MNFGPFANDRTGHGEDRIHFKPGIASVEWRCQFCGERGSGFPPDEHSSGACEATRTIVPASGYMDGGGI
jgi:hypothetical protein